MCVGWAGWAIIGARMDWKLINRETRSHGCFVCFFGSTNAIGGGHPAYPFSEHTIAFNYHINVALSLMGDRFTRCAIRAST